MKRLILIITCLGLFALSLLSCVGIATPQPAVNLPVTVEGDKTPTPELFDYAVEYSPEGATATYEAKIAPTATPLGTPTYTSEEQGAVATALALAGDKAPNLRIYKVLKFGSGYVIRLQQTYQGIAVEGATTRVNIKPDQDPRISSTFFSNIKLPSITPTITFSEAIPIAVETIDLQGDYWISPKKGLIIVQVPAEEKSKRFVLAWVVRLTARCPSGNWFVHVNAYTGDPLRIGENGISENPDARGGCPTPVPVRPTKIWLGTPPTPTPTPNLLKNDAVATAIAYLGNKAPHLKIQTINKSGSKENPTFTIDFQQQYHRLPVHNALTQVQIQWNTPPTSTGLYFSDVQLPSITPTIPLSKAIPIAVDALGVQDDYWLDIDPILTVYQVPAEEKSKGFVLAWEIYLGVICPTGYWVVNINAYTGDVLFYGSNNRIDDTRAKCPTPPPLPLPTKIPASTP